MLSVGPGARRFSPSQDIHVRNALPAVSVMYITDNTTLTSSQSGLTAGKSARLHVGSQDDEQESSELRPQAFLASVGAGRSVDQIPTRADRLPAGRCGRCRLLHPEGQGQAHRRLRAGQGRRHRDAGRRRFLRRGMPGRPASAYGLGVRDERIRRSSESRTIR